MSRNNMNNITDWYIIANERRKNTKTWSSNKNRIKKENNKYYQMIDRNYAGTYPRQPRG